MLRVSRLTDYATVILATMAREPGGVHTAADLAQRTQLGRATVSKLLKRFARNGVLHSYRGAHGGYGLAESPDRISAARIIELAEGPVAMTECSLAQSQCELEGLCGIGHHWQRINQAIQAALDEISLADLAASTTVAVPPLDLRRALHGGSTPHERESQGADGDPVAANG
jgi:FeS assembly SUF system regulator